MFFVMLTFLSKFKWAKLLKQKTSNGNKISVKNQNLYFIIFAGF